MADARNGYILVVDDVQFIRRQIARMLTTLGYDVLDSADPHHAIQTIQLDPPLLVILEQVMPHMSGAELCAWIRKNEATRHTPVIMCTAAPDRKVLEKAIRAGASDIIIKPVTKDMLRERLEKHLGKSA